MLSTGTFLILKMLQFTSQDDCKTELNSLKKQLSELQNNQQQSEKKINSMSNTLRSLQEEKSCLETKLSQKQGAYQINVIYLLK